MPLTGLTDAIESIRIKVRSTGAFHETKTPAALLRVLFKRLTDAVLNGSDVGLPLERVGAEDILTRETKFDSPTDFESAWKTAVTAITDAMNEVRDHGAPPPVPSDSGVACIRFPIDRVESFVIVEGPRMNGNSYLQLRVRTIPVADVERKPARDAAVLPRLRVRSWPEGVEASFYRILEQVTRALHDCNHDERRRSLITQYVFMVVKGLEDAALQLGLGEIDTQYEDFALLSAQVEAMQLGDELLGLTEWEKDWEWWESEPGRRFRDANERAVRQGGVVRRIFLHDEKERDAIRKRRRREMLLHREMGVQVKAISIKQVRQFRRTAENVRSRCVLWSGDEEDGWLTYSVETSVDGHPDRNRFSFHPDDVKDNCSLLEEIWNHAHE